MPTSDSQIANTRIFRLAAGTALSLWFSAVMAWPLSFVAPVITLLILSQPMPAFKVKAGVGLVVILGVAIYGGMFLLPRLQHQPAVGVILLTIALYWSFYFTARGGSPALGTIFTAGIALSVAVGSASIDALLEVASSLVMSASAGVVFVWIAHALFPDRSKPPEAKPPLPKPDLVVARWAALRSLVIVLPIALWLVMSAGSAAYIPVMLKVASMGQQTTMAGTTQAGRSLLASTVIGGSAAIISWYVLAAVPILTIYVLLIAIAGLTFGRKIFAGTGLHADAETWSYALLTAVVILAPAVADGIGGAPAAIKFWDRILMFALATLYAIAAVYIVDGLAGRKTANSTA